MRTEIKSTVALCLMNVYYNRSSTIGIDAINDVFAQHRLHVLFTDMLGDKGS